nr:MULTISPECIES: ASCH domain-containing protein [Cryobacterium]
MAAEALRIAADLTAAAHPATHDLPIAEFAFPGPLRDQLVAAILDGSKTSTTSTLIEYGIEDEPLPVIGSRQVVIDSAGRPAAIIETTGMRVVRLGAVDLDHARAEGEGYDSVAAWRVGHESFWHSDDMRAYLGDPAFTVTDDTEVVLERLRLIEVLPRA